MHWVLLPFFQSLPLCFFPPIISLSPFLSVSICLCRDLWLQSCRIQTTANITTIITWIVAAVINNIFTSIIIPRIVFIITTSLSELRPDGAQLFLHGLSLLFLPLSSTYPPPLSSLPSFPSSTLSSPFFSAHPDQSRQMAAHTESDFLLSAVAKLLLIVGTVVFLSLILRSWPSM